jgi:hypothetical protein
MALTLRETIEFVAEGNKEALIASGKRRVGNIINERVSNIVIKKLPFAVKGYVNNDIGKAVISNIIAGTIIKYLPENKKAVSVANAMLISSADKILENLDIEKILNDILDGIDISELEE